MVTYRISMRNKQPNKQEMHNEQVEEHTLFKWEMYGGAHEK